MPDLRDYQCFHWIKRGGKLFFPTPVSCFVFVFLCRVDSVIMPLIKCVAVRDSKACRKEFSEDGHDVCVAYCPCVFPLFVYDPETCVKCLDHVKSWETVKQLARCNLLPPSWKNTDLMEFLFPSSQMWSPSQAPFLASPLEQVAEPADASFIHASLSDGLSQQIRELVTSIMAEFC